MIKRCLTSLFATLIVCFLACSSASARVCFLPDSTDCGEGEGKGGIVGSGNVEVPCQYSSCPAYNPKYQECYKERIYNNGGVNVECRQVKCKLSKSACEEQEDDPNSSQCCNFDSASGCYYMGDCPVLCNRNIYDSTTDRSGEDYTCTSCKDKNGTFYNCTAIEKECKDIKPVNTYTSKCDDSQIPVIAKGIKDSQGNQCYTCKLGTVDIVKPVITITYKETYHSLTPNTSDSDPDPYYYKTLKFTATSSDTINRTIQMKTYPTRTCKLKYQTGSPVTINEGVETTYASSCGVSSELLPVTSTAALDVFIDNKQVYSLEPYYSIKGDDFAQLDGKTVEAQGYTLKFVKGKTCSESSKGFWIGEKDKNTCPTGYKPEVVESTVGATVYSDGPCYKCTIGNCFGKESKIYYVTYGQYLQGNVAYQSACQCSSYLVKGNSPNITPLKPGGPIKINAISTPGGGSSSTEKIKLPTILTGVSSSNPYSVRIQEYNCLGDEHCSAQAVKFDVFEKYAPDTAKSLKEDDYFFDGVGVATTFEEGLYFYTGRPLKPKSQSINTCDDYVVILGNGNPKACAQKSSDYYNYQEACPKGLEKKRLPNVYDSTGAQCYTCEKPV